MKYLTVLLFALFLWTESRADPLTTDEKRTFVRWFSECYPNERARWIQSLDISRLEVSLISFDLNGDGQDEIIASNPYYRDRTTDFPLIFHRVKDIWQMLPFQSIPFERLGGASVVEFSGGRFRLVHLGMETGRVRYKSFVCDRPRAARSGISGAPVKPSLTESQIDAWLSVYRPEDALAAGLPEESCIGVTDNGGGSVQFRCFYEKMSFSQLGIDESGAPTNQVCPGGARDMIANPDFRSWIRDVPIDVFAGTNAEPRRLADPCYARTGSCRTIVETNRLSAEQRELLARSLRQEGFPSNDVRLIVVDLDDDGVPEAFVSTNRTMSVAQPMEWRVWRYSGANWIPVLSSISPPVKTVCQNFCDWTIAPPSIPPIILAGPNDFYRIWHSAGGSFVNVFRVTGPNSWDVSSPLSDAETPAEMKKTRFLNGYRRVYSDWIALHDFFHPGTNIHPPCDFFDLFDVCSGMIQLDRLLPEKLLP